MNSNSSNYYNDDDDCRKEKDPCKKEKKKECPVIIKCGCPGTVTIPAGTRPPNGVFTVTSLSLDTSDLCNPCSKIEFTSNLVASEVPEDGGGFRGTVNFQVVKQCNNQFTPTKIGPAFTYSVILGIESQTFTFFVCDCDCSCNSDCCTYSVIATVVAPAGGGTVGTLDIRNATLGVITACNTRSCC